MQVSAQVLSKKAIAMLLGITMAFGTLVLPDTAVRNELTQVSAFELEANDCTFTYFISDRTEEKTIKIANVKFTGDTVEIPSVINHEGKDYPVTDIGSGFLKNNKQIKTVIVPDSVEYIDVNFLCNSSVEKIVLSNNLIHMGYSFADSCSSLTSIECTNTKLIPEEVGGCILRNSDNLVNENGAVCIGNMLVRYEGPQDIKELKIADLGNDDIKITHVGGDAVKHLDELLTLDLEGVEYIGRSNFYNFENLTYVINTDDLKMIEGHSLSCTPWIDNIMKGDLVRLGSVLMHYKTYDNVLDLTSGKLAGIKGVYTNALLESKNIDTIKCDSDCIFEVNCFSKFHQQDGPNESISDPMPMIPTYQIKKVYINGKELTNSLIRENRAAYEWFRKNNAGLKGSVFAIEMVEEKTKELFDQMEIPYYGRNNDMAGTHTPTEEFYIRLKIHDYLSQYDYDMDDNYGGDLGAFILGGDVQCDGYAYLAHYLLECAGIEAKTLDGNSHYWNMTKIGDLWFENDDGWNAQGVSHKYTWFGLSTERVGEIDHSVHKFQYKYDSYHKK